LRERIQKIALYDADAGSNLHFPSFPVQSGTRAKTLVFPRILAMKTTTWLGAESNRRHVDFQSTALPTELPSRDAADRGAPWDFHYATMLL
jgi:hypothetical protein